MNKFVSLLATSTAVCALILGSVAVAGVTASTSGDSSGQSSSQQQGSANFSFVIEAAHGKLTQVSGKQFQLVIPTGDVKSVLAFSSRPDRIAKQMSPDDFAKMVHSGSDSFDTNPPNMALTFGNGDSIAFEVKGVVNQDGNLAYSLVLLGDQTEPQAQSGNVSLFIDDIGLDIAVKIGGTGI